MSTEYVDTVRRMYDGSSLGDSWTRARLLAKAVCRRIWSIPVGGVRTAVGGTPVSNRNFVLILVAGASRTTGSTRRARTHARERERYADD